MKNAIALLSLAALLSACTSTTLAVEQPLTANVRADAVNLQFVSGSPNSVSDEAAAYLQRRMEREFFAGPIAFRRGSDITIRYGFAGYDEGSRFGRWLTAGLAGEAKMVIQAEFVDSSGAVLSRVRSISTQRRGVYGGSHNSAIDEAVEEIALYAAANFRTFGKR